MKNACTAGYPIGVSIWLCLGHSQVKTLKIESACKKTVHIGVRIWLYLGQSQVKTLKMESASKKTYYGVGFVPPFGEDS